MRPSSFEDPTLKILEFSAKFLLKKPLSNPLLQQLSTEASFPSMSRAILARISNEYSNGATRSQILRSCGYYFPFQPQRLEAIAQINFNLASENDANYAAAFSLFSFISLVSVAENTSAMGFLPVLLSALSKTINSECAELISSAFLYSFALFCSKGDFFEFGSVLHSLRLYIFNPNIKAGVLLPLFSDILKILLPDSPTAFELIDIIDDLFVQRPSEFSASSLHSIFEAFEPLFQSLNPKILNSYSILCPGLSDYDRKAFFHVILSSLFTLIFRSPAPFSIPPPSTTGVTLLAIEKTNPISYDFPTASIECTYTTSLPLLPIFNGQSLVASEVTETLMPIEYAIKNSKDLIPLFFDFFDLIFVGDSTFIQKTECLAVFLALSASLNSERIQDLLSHSNIFDPNFICTPSNVAAEYSSLNQLRDQAFQSLTRSGGLNHFLLLSLSYPPMFLEFTQRTISHFSEVSNQFASAPLSQFPAKALVNLYEAFYAKIDGSILSRLFLFRLIGLLLSSSQIAEAIFSDSLFIPAFFRCVFETYLCGTVLSEVSNFLINHPTSQSGPMIGAVVTDAISIIGTHLPEERSILLLHNIVLFLNQIVSESPKNVSAICGAIDPLFQEMSKLDTSDVSQKVILNTLQFGMNCSSSFKLKASDIPKIKIAIKKITPALLDQLAEYAALDSDARFSKPYVIKEPKIIILLFELLEADNASAFCKNIIGLCEFSNLNALKLHDGEFDLFLLENLSQHWEDKICEAEDILKAFSAIASVSTSPIVVQKFVDLLSPIKASYFSKYVPAAFNCMTSMLSSKDPIESIPLKAFQLELKEISLDGSADIVFWLYFRESKDGAQLIKIIGNSLSVTLFLSHKYLYLSMNGSTPVAASKALSNDKWNFVGLRFREDLEVNLNGSSIGFPSFPLKGQFTFKIGSSTTCESLIGPLAAYDKLSSENFDCLCWNTRYLSKITSKALLSIPHESLSFHLPTFIEVFCSCLKFDSLIPIFSFLRVSFLTGEPFSRLLSILLNILSLTLSIGSEVQSAFASSNGFAVIAFLLAKAEDLVNYSLYLNFFSMLQEAYSEKLKENLLDSVILNIDLWRLSSPNDQTKIYCHWLTSIYPSFSEICFRIRKFDRVLSDVIFNYVDLKGDVTCFFPVTVLTVSDSEKPLSILTQILLVTSFNCFTIEDYYFVVSFCGVTRRKEFANTLLGLFSQMASATPSPLIVLRGNDGAVSLLRGLLRNLGEARAALEVLIKLYKMKVLQSELAFEVETFIRELPTTLFNSDFLKYLAGIMKEKTPELLPLCSRVAIFLGEEDAIELFKSTPPSPDYTTTSLWAIWPIAYCFACSQEARNSVFDFIILCSPSSVETTYSTIFAVADSVGADASELSAEFLHRSLVILSSYGEKYVESAIGGFISCLSHHLFFRIEKKMTAPLMAEFMKSPFKFAVNEETEKNAKNIDFLGAFDRFNTSEKTVSFGLRLDQNSCWLDKDLASDSINFLRFYQDQRSIRLCLVICFFLKRYLPYSVAAFFSSISYDGNSKTQSPISDISDLQPSLPIGQIESDIHDVSSKCQAQTLLFCSLIPSEPIDSWREHFVSAILDAKQRSEEEERAWRQIWSLQSLSGERHFQRDFAACFCFCPFKLKRNWDFTRHEKAASARDSGISKEESTKSFTRIPKAKPSSNAFSCMFISMKTTEVGFIEFYHDSLYIRAQSKQAIISYKKIVAFYLRSHLGLPIAIELFSETGYGRFIVFQSQTERDSAFKRLQSMASNRMPLDLNNLTEDWVKGRLSNFQYLLFVNFLSSRSFNNPAQYPIFPWILSDYNGEKLNLSDKSIFRDLSKPIGAINEKRLAALEKLMQDLRALDMKGHLYSNGPIHSLTVFLYLIRLEPFTSLHIEMQSGKFDCSTRIFSSIPSLFKSVNNDMNDFRELIPEFYFSPEFLVNSDGFDLGTGKGDVVLPPWASSPIDFIYQHRKALESEYVSSHLNEWIDLIWGYKQDGEEAEKASNLYFPLLYQNAWEEAGDDPDKLKNVETSQTFLGQIPTKLFKAPHPKKLVEVCKTISKRVEFDGRRAFDSAFIEAKRNIIVTFISKSGIIQSKVDEALREDKLITFSVNGHPKIPIVYSGKLIAVECGQKVLVYDTNSNSIVKSVSSVICAAFSRKFFAIVTQDSIVDVYKSDLSYYRTASIYRDTPRCCCISETFHSIVTATKDGTVFVCSLESGSLSTTFNLGPYLPKSIEITQSWGFIVCYATSLEKERGFIFVHTINGQFVRSAPVTFDVTCLTSFSSPNGFDFLILSSGKFVFVCEAYCLDISKPFFKSQISIASICYNPSNRTIVVALSDGAIIEESVD